MELLYDIYGNHEKKLILLHFWKENRKKKNSKYKFLLYSDN